MISDFYVIWLQGYGVNIPLVRAAIVPVGPGMICWGMIFSR